MSSDIPRGIIELGNINIKCLIFRINNDNTSEILSTYTIKSEGIHNGVIINSKKASDVIRSCISTAEKKAKVLIKKIIVVIEQPEFLCTKLSKNKKIDGSKIHKYDIDFLLKEAKKQVTSNDDKQSIIHIFNHNYNVDGKKFKEEPIDVYANSLSHEMTFITMPKNNLKNIRQAFLNCDIEIERFISCTFALAVKLLNINELQSGSILIDMGFEKTSLGLFKNLALVHSITLPIGINHIKKDISKICSLSLKESEIISNKIDFSFQKNKELQGSSVEGISLDKLINSMIFNLEFLCDTIDGIPFDELSDYVTVNLTEKGEKKFRQELIILGKNEEQIDVWFKFAKFAVAKRYRTLDAKKVHATIQSAEHFVKRYLELAKRINSKIKLDLVIQETQNLTKNIQKFLESDLYLSQAIHENSQIPYADWDENYGGS